jgi:hypothetical protein
VNITDVRQTAYFVGVTVHSRLFKKARETCQKLARGSDGRIAIAIREMGSIGMPENAYLLIRLDALKEAAQVIHRLARRYEEDIHVECYQRVITIHNGVDTIIKEITETFLEKLELSQAEERQEVSNLRHVLALDLKDDPNAHRRMGAFAE